MGSGYVLYLDYCEDIICVYVCQKFLNHTFQYLKYCMSIIKLFLEKNLAEYLLLLEIHSVESTNTDG